MMKTVQSFVVSNKAFTNQMLGQQLLIQLGKEISPHGDSPLFAQELQGYYKYHKITLFSTDTHLNHQIFVRKQELIESLATKMKQMFGVEVMIKDIIFVARDNKTSLIE